VSVARIFMSNAKPPAEDYPAIMGAVVEWLVDLSQRRLDEARHALASAEMVLGGLGYEEQNASLRAETVDLPAPQRSLSRLAGWFGEVERELEERRSLILQQRWESMAGEYALVAMQNLTEARQYLGLAQSAVASLLVSLAANKLNAWEKQTKLYGVRLYLERLETAITWAIESATNGLRQYELDAGPRRPPPPAASRISTGAVSFHSPQPEAPASPAPPENAPAPAHPPSSPSSQPDPPAASEARRSGWFDWLRRRKETRQ
jgi:hypothetical protein